MATKKAVRTNSHELQFGAAGSVFTNTNTQVVAPTGKCFVALQFISDTTSSTLTKFPRGMVIYGRWESFTIDADPLGGVIAYISQ